MRRWEHVCPRSGIVVGVCSARAAKGKQRADDSVKGSRERWLDCGGEGASSGSRGGKVHPWKECACVECAALRGAQKVQEEWMQECVAQSSVS